jgi:Fur family ferric uptake transcriptional regulator
MTTRLELLCQQRGVKLTRARRLVLGVLEKSRDHPSADEIQQRAALTDRITLGTVYRILNRLVMAGILRRAAFSGGKMRYEVASARHQHLVDVRTGQIVELDGSELAALVQQTAERLGYRLVDFKLEVSGEPELESKDKSLFD